MNAQISEPELERLGVTLVSGWSFPAHMWRDLVAGLDARPVTLISWYELGSWLMGKGPLTPALEEALSRPIWVGWSLGGALLQVALVRAAVRPQRALIVAAMPRLLEADGWPGITAAGMRGLRRQVGQSPTDALKGFDEWLGLDTEIERQVDAGMLEQGLDWLTAVDCRSALQQLPCRVDWMGGSADPLVQPDWYGKIPRTVGQSLLVGDAGHGLPFTHAHLIRGWIERDGFAAAL